jgi:glucose-6-phosphate 1-epimerase
MTTLIPGNGGLPKLVIENDGATAEVYQHGAHLTAWQPRGQKPVLFMSRKSAFDPAKPIRGGVPICFPWFGPKAGAPDAPMHGYARLRDWTLEYAGRDGVSFILESEEATARLTFTIGAALDMALEVRARKDFTYEEALHTYLRVGDVRRVSVEGLEGVDYLDKTDGFRRKTQAGPITVAAETDRIYLKTKGVCVVRDPVLGRSITVEKEGSDNTVVWNPWIAKAKAMADFGDDEWPDMICVETANVGDAAVRLTAGQTHLTRARVSVR